MLLQAGRSLLMIVDLQTSLAGAVENGRGCIQTARFLIEAARALDVPLLATEQYPERLGPTVEELRARIPPERIHAKLAFAASGEPEIREAVLESQRPQLVVAGMEAHVCVLQTALGFKALGLDPVVVADAVASRSAGDRERALARMQAAGVPVVTGEMVAFEWLERAGTPAFSNLLPLIRDRAR